ncbi:MAG: hypothetical protein OEM62_11185 [Acidobacteriota bacterium]|nr:hypothetical protein [Acidobacteriota bacterium]
MMRNLELLAIVGVLLAMLGLGWTDGSIRANDPSPHDAPAPSHGLAWND